MKRVILILIFVLFVFFTSISSLSASEDINETILTASDADEITAYCVNEYNPDVDVSDTALGIKKDDDLLTSNIFYVNGSVEESGNGSEYSPYKTISEAISTSGEGDTIYIAYGIYSGTGNVALTIDKELSLYGSDVILDGEENSRIFYVTASNVLIDGFTFKNAYANWGSAIYFESGSKNNVINNSKFINNRAGNSAGAIYFDKDEGTSISNTIFENNTAVYNAGAIYFYQDAYNTLFENVTFKNNSANNNGGAIYSYYAIYDCNFTDVNFIDNKVSNYYGGAVLFNTASNVIIKNSNFTNNRANAGGAIIYWSATDSVCIINTNFENNSAVQWGGAVLYWSDSNNDIFADTSFKNNTAYYGSAIYLVSQYNLNLTDDSFIDNQASSVSLTANIDKFDSTISALWQGGNNLMNAVYSSSLDNILFSNVTYWNGYAFVNSDDAEPLSDYSAQNITLTIYDAAGEVLLFNESQLTDENGSVVFDYSGLSKDNLFNYAVYHNENNYYTSMESTGEFNPNIGDFEALQYLVNQASENEIIELTRNYTYTIGIDTSTGIIINKNNLTIKGNGYVIDALAQSRIFNVQSETFSLENLTLKNAYSTANGGAIYFTVTACDCNFKDVTFINNTVKGGSNIGGAAFYIPEASNNNFTGLTLINNSAYGSSNIFGGAIYIPASSYNNFTGLNAVNNSANYGGAIYLTSSSHDVISQSNFTNNSGIAVYLKTSSNNLLNQSLFLNNPGGLYFSSSTNDKLCNLTFNNNSISKKGAAINFAGNVKSIEFINMIFEANDAGSYGGAVFFGGDVKSFEFINVTFKSNNAGYDGGAICFDEESEVNNGFFTNISFINNTARYGGAIAYCDDIEASNIKISDSQFINNSAKNGGAISYYGAALNNISYINVLFMNNHHNQSSGSTTGGGAISYYSSTDSTDEKIINSTFINNTATYGGGAIYYYSGSSSNYAIVNTSFIGNNANNYGGAMYLSSLKNAKFNNITCINNTANLGGVIYFIRQCDNNEISNSIFVNNTGNSIYYYNTATSADTIINSVFLNNGGRDIYASSSNVVANYNWFGNNATNYNEEPYVSSAITSDIWLFLNATSQNDTLFTGDISNVKFVLEAYDQSSDSIINEDYQELKQITLNLTSVNETLSQNQSSVGESVEFYANKVGTGTITAKYLTAEYTIEFTNIRGNSSVIVEDVSADYGTAVELIANCIGATAISPKLYDEQKNDITDTYLEYDGFNIKIKNTLNAGTYTLNVTTIVDEENFNPVTNSSAVFINPASSSVIINNVTDGVFNTSAPGINYSVINETSVTFTINDVNGAVVKNISSESDLEAALLALDWGIYTVSIFNAKGVNFNASNATSEEFVIHRASSSVIINNITDGVFNTSAPGINYSVVNETSVTFTITDENDTVIDNMPISNLTSQLIKLNAGEYNITITNSEYGNFNASSDKKSFIILKANSTIYVDDYSAMYGDIVNLTAICENTTGITAVIYDENDVYYNDNLEINGFNITITGLDTGHYIINTTSLVDENHINTTISSNLYIYANSSVIVNDVYALYNETIAVTAICNNATSVNAKIYDENGSEAYADLTVDGFNITISSLDAGNYTLNVTTITETYYLPYTNSSKIIVKKSSSSIVLEEYINSLYGSEITTEANCINATGVTAKIYDESGDEVSANITINAFNITISGLNAGNYTLNVTTITDNNHIPSSNISNIMINKTNSSVYIEDIIGGSGQIIVLDAICENATGITVKIYDDDGNDYCDNIIVAGFKLIIYNLPNGHYIINASTIVNENHNSANNSSNIYIRNASYVYVENISVTYNETVNLSAICSNALGVNATLYDENESEISADLTVDGFNIIIYDLSAGSYVLKTTTIVDEYSAPATYYSSVIVNKANSTVYANDSITFYGDIINLTAVCENATGVNAALYGENGSAVDCDIIIDGFAIVISNLNAGNYTLELTTVVSDNYNVATDSSCILVNKCNSTVVVENVDADYGDVINITAVCENATGVNAALYDENMDVIDANITITGFNIFISNLNAGNYILELTTLVDDNHYSTTNSSSVIVRKANITLILRNASDINPQESEIINVELSDLNIDGNLTYTFDGFTYAVNDLIIILNNLTEGNYTVLVELTNDTNYNYASNSTAFAVSKVDYNIGVVCQDIKVNESSYISITLPGDATGNVTISINNDTQVILINETTVFGLNGILSMLIVNDNLSAGNYDVVAVYGGNDKYNPSTATANFTVSKFDDYPVELTFENNIITINLPEDAAGNVSVEIENNTYSGNIVNGSVKIDVSDLSNANYTANVNYSGDEKYVGYSGYINITVFNHLNLTAPSVVKYYGGSERLYVYLLDNEGNGVSNSNISITINGITYSRITDENGVASLALNLISGEYDVSVEYVGEEIISINTSVTVKTTVNGTDIVKIFRNGTQYFATFRDSEGKYLENGAEVNFNINGVYYTRYIYGNEGLARLNINLEQGEYIITAINPKTGEMTSNNITVLSRITENHDLEKYYKNDSQYVVRIIGDDGNPVGAGESVTFNINGVFYTRVTDESGYVKLNINLEAGEYVITVIYKECRVSNNIVVKPVLYAKDLVKKYGTSDQFRALLLDGEGNPYEGQEITFNIHGVFYTRITDADGYASLNIKLQAAIDEYIITSTYNGASISNKITIVE